MGVDLAEIVSFLDCELRTSTIPDYPGAVNGLQLANSGKISRVVAAVDASESVIEAAAGDGGGLLIVHHGLFWQGAQPITGPVYRKLKTAMDADLAIYSSHLPLDVHPVWGNNVLLAKAIGLSDIEPFFERKSVKLGVRGVFSGLRSDLSSRLALAVGGPVHQCSGGPEAVMKVGIVTGGAGSEVAEIAKEGVDTFVTGEGPHWSYVLAEELKINVLYAGHYATETFGVRALAAAVAERVGLKCSFIDRPTGL